MLRAWLMLFLMGCQGTYNSTPIKALDDEASLKGHLTGICALVEAKKPGGPLMSLADLGDRFLKSHNEIRKLYGLKALVWREDLAQYSQEWADYLKSKYQCKMHHRSVLGITDGKRYGENLAWYLRRPAQPNIFLGSPESVTISWSKECQDYNYVKNTCPKDKMCGHFTQVIWNNTRAVGCAMAVCNVGVERSEIWVCSYDPPGNITMMHQDGTKEKLRPF